MRVYTVMGLSNELTERKIVTTEFSASESNEAARKVVICTSFQQGMKSTETRAELFSDINSFES